MESRHPRREGNVPGPRELERLLDRALTRDAGKLRARLRGLERKWSSSPDALRKLARDIAASVAQREARVALVPPITLDEALPITQRSDDITRLIRGHQVLVIAGETGSGKTTQLPKLCLAAGRGVAGMIGCTQPRRLAARAMAHRVANELGGETGGMVGFEVRFARQLGDDTLIKFMTDGILLAEMAHDRWLSAYDTLIIDEAHERSLNIDFLLGYLKGLLRRRPDLKLIVTSATIDTARFAEHFDNAPVVTVEGRAYPVEIRYRPSGNDFLPPQAGEGGRRPDGGRVREESLTERVASALDDIAREDPKGDVLVFLPGEREIRDAHLALSRRQYRHTEVLPLYARLSVKEQDRVFKPGPARRIVLATNVAETSLTVPRIRWVVDSGDARVKRYSRRSQIERLHIEPVSQAAANQRAGRCGRVGPGICVRLYDEADFAARPPYSDPEILRSALSDVILRMLDLGLGDVEAFPFIDPPDPRAVNDGWRRLAEIGAVDEARKLTPLGKQLAHIPIDAQLARMLVEAQRLGVLAEVLPIVAFLGVQDPRERPADKQAQADAAHREFADPQSDFIGVSNLWIAYRAAHEELTQAKLRDWCAKHFVSFMRMREWRELHRQLLVEAGTRDSGLGTRERQAVERVAGTKRVQAADVRKKKASAETTGASPESRVPSPDLYESIHLALLAGLPTNVARKDEQGLYRGTRERKFKVFPGSMLAKKPPVWLFVAQILDLGGKVWGMQCARVEPEWIERQAAHLLKRTCSDPHWSRARGTVQAFEQVSLYGLVLAERRTVTFAKQDPALAHAIFLREALARCDIDCRADFVHANAWVLDEAREIEAQQRREGLLKSDEDLATFFTGKLPEEIASSAALDAWYKRASAPERAALRWSLRDVLEAGAHGDAGAFPEAMEVGNQRLRFEYRFVPGDPADGVTLHVPLPLLNAIPVARCEWLVPGLLQDKVAALIRGLPKTLRRNFVPAPEFARAFSEAEAPRDQPLAQSLSAFLKKVTGVVVDAADFDMAGLPAHLRMRFEVRDESGKVLAEGRGLDSLRERWADRARAAFSRNAAVPVAREDVRDWDFDAIPRVSEARGGMPAFPALVDLGATVALRVFETRGEADAAHRGGVERLLRLSLATESRRAQKQLPLKPKLAVAFAPHGRADTLREDIVEGAFADVLREHDLDVRDRGEWQALRDAVSRVLFGAAMERLKLAEPILAGLAELQPWLKPSIKGEAGVSYADLRGQLDALLAPGFLRELPRARLAHLPRYLKAMRLRAEKLRSDPARDFSRMQQVLPYWRAVLDAHASGEDSDALDALRWLVEEWRVSVFAQELKTAEPVSGKRMAQALQGLKT
ncbi:MAG: ATP-dependent RNA helicase HrpA [Xanthomonadales bacterium]|nr:ATP-dependent RNA helicase HrpA [Xanthomonadales bacterium]ODU91646.1 MAG: ATP-dependent RNA helicase HrpA [Rhodanobacter sp. SCN 66-43]OJY86589.1 MAG: ATP-dependent RNA helicase HrpA [Xanthomonadales bacterium 66-474]